MRHGSPNFDILFGVLFGGIAHIEHRIWPLTAGRTIDEFAENVGVAGMSGGLL
jgi:hypothetical protein